MPYFRPSPGNWREYFAAAHHFAEDSHCTCFWSFLGFSVRWDGSSCRSTIRCIYHIVWRNLFRKFFCWFWDSLAHPFWPIALDGRHFWRFRWSDSTSMRVCISQNGALHPSLKGLCRDWCRGELLFRRKIRGDWLVLSTQESQTMIWVTLIYCKPFRKRPATTENGLFMKRRKCLNVPAIPCQNPQSWCLHISMVYGCKPINHDTDDRCHAATRKSQVFEANQKRNCRLLSRDARVELLKGNQKSNYRGLGAEISTSMAFMGGALEVVSSCPRMNSVVMPKGNSRRREPSGSLDTIWIVHDQLVCLDHPGISRSRILQPVLDSACRREGTYGISHPNSITIGNTRRIRPSKSKFIEAIQGICQWQPQRTGEWIRLIYVQCPWEFINHYVDCFAHIPNLIGCCPKEWSFFPTRTDLRR
jgi:hypothetical protein